jgi:hydroxyacylglutathione hydrolase
MKKGSSELRIEKIPLGPCQANCYIVEIADSGKGVVIDPAAEPEFLAKKIKSKSLEITYVINTHGHYDHIAGNHLVSLLDPKPSLLIHAEDRLMLLEPAKNLSALLGPGYISPEADIIAEDGMEFSIAESVWRIIHTPGHTPGSICLVMDRVLFTGDTIFCGSIGRTDLPGGSPSDMARSLQKIISFSPDTVLCPGHGENSTVQNEIDGNPFLNG